MRAAHRLQSLKLRLKTVGLPGDVPTKATLEELYGHVGEAGKTAFLPA
jgi:hypothetical protein